LFTGIVEETGRVRVKTARDGGFRFVVEASKVLGGLSEGHSIAVDGVCQTVIAADDGSFTVETIATTLSRTTLGRLEPGDEVNLERSLEYGGRVGGHLVQGHVDGVGDVIAVERRDEHVLVDVRVPRDVGDVTVPHGSITMHGVSLTVNELKNDDVVQVALIPHTWEHTTLRLLEPGSCVNVEGDILGKFVAHLMTRRTGTP
jgi:riboflavin synthase